MDRPGYRYDFSGDGKDSNTRARIVLRIETTGKDLLTEKPEMIVKKAIESGISSFEFHNDELCMLPVLSEQAACFGLGPADMDATWVNSFDPCKDSSVELRNMEKVIKETGRNNVISELGLIVSIGNVDARLQGRLIDKLRNIMAAGLFKYTGVLLDRDSDPLPWLNLKIDLAGFERSFNACNLSIPLTYLKSFREKGIMFCIWDPMHNGLLGNLLQQYSRAGEEPGKVKRRDITTAVMASRIASEAGIDIAELAFRFSISFGGVDRIVVYVRDVKTVENIGGWMKKGPLEKRLYDRIIDNIFKYNNQ